MKIPGHPAGPKRWPACTSTECVKPPTVTSHRDSAEVVCAYPRRPREIHQASVVSSNSAPAAMSQPAAPAGRGAVDAADGGQDAATHCTIAHIYSSLVASVGAVRDPRRLRDGWSSVRVRLSDRLAVLPKGPAAGPLPLPTNMVRTSEMSASGVASPRAT